MQCLMLRLFFHPNTDIYGNKINKEGEIFLLKVEKIDNLNIEAEIIDYNAEFIQKYLVLIQWIVIDKEKYGETVSIIINGKKCFGNTPNFCTNTNEFVGNIQDFIIPPEYYPFEKPFKCKVNGSEIWSKSQIDCNCHLEFMKYDIMR